MNIHERLNPPPLLDISAQNKADKIIGGKSSGVVNWNDIKYPQMYEIYKTLLTNFWRAEEIQMNEDVNAWKTLSKDEQEAFLNVNGLIAVLDSVQPALLSNIKNYFSDSSIREIFTLIEQQEVVHNQSYSYVLSSIVPLETQKKAFDMAITKQEIYARNNLIIDVYEEFRANPTIYNIAKSLIASIILEGINFYSSFAFFYNLARNKKMIKTSTIISYINKDEFSHSFFMSLLVKLMVKEIPEINENRKLEKFAHEIFEKAVELEIEWSRFVLKKIEQIDLEEMSDYIRYRANKCLGMLEFNPIYEGVDENSMPWIRVFSDENINNSKTDFFENKSRNYGKVSQDNGFDEL